ncbi:hypothetical protein B2J93_4119 [Marssonina coronariae]|uniref:Uncharacterized protein n=1 Tax=Diplocarpon coronariae TaxID=2795749 RepID=A0A218Z9T9_9HELO|nr:hypothetical protein B2J93_4119 [Marssonina coronariae]
MEGLQNKWRLRPFCTTRAGLLGGGGDSSSGKGGGDGSSGSLPSSR